MRSTPGLVDAHSHLRSTALIDHGVPGTCLEDSILRMNAMTAVDQRDDALVASGNLLLSGFTGVQIIFHTFGNPDHYLATLGAMIDGIQSSGIRARIILAITDQCEFIPERLRDFPFPPFVNPGERMKPSQFEEVVVEALRRFPRSHMQRGWIKESPLVRLRRFGLLNSRASFAHAIWLTSDELAEVKNSGAQLVTCPHSNQILRAGTAPIQSWLDLDIPFAIGLDISSDPHSLRRRFDSKWTSDFQR